jgi:hypothetical protein
MKIRMEGQVELFNWMDLEPCVEKGTRCSQRALVYLFFYVIDLLMGTLQFAFETWNLSRYQELKFPRN